MQASIAVTVKKVVQQLERVTDVPQLEAEIILAHVLQTTRVYLHTWPEKEMTAAQNAKIDEYVTRRLQGEPIAYLVGSKEFWSLNLRVTKDVLIPRPETERIVELALLKISSSSALVADLGTGSGAIALALAVERPGWTIYAVDLSPAALEIAQWNAAQLSLSNVVFCRGNWCNALPQLQFDAIISNPPYIDQQDPHLIDLCFEPHSALVSEKKGLFDLASIIRESKNHLKQSGLVMLEHGSTQAKNVLSFFTKEGYTHIDLYQDMAGLDRVTTAVWSSFGKD